VQHLFCIQCDVFLDEKVRVRVRVRQFVWSYLTLFVTCDVFFYIKIGAF